MRDPVVMTDRNGRAWLPHGLDAPPTWVLLRVGDDATEQQKSLIRLVVDEFDEQMVGFRAVRSDTGASLANAALTVRMSAR